MPDRTHCTVKNCHFWNNGACRAAAIEVKPEVGAKEALEITGPLTGP